MIPGYLAVLWREMVLLWKKTGKFGYVFSTLLFPLVYLFSFGLGLGGRFPMDGGYTAFLVGGIAGITVMLNSFQQTALSVSVGRLHFRTFQILIMSPVSPVQIVLGIVAAGVLRGVVAGVVILGVAAAVFGGVVFSGPALAGMLLGSFCFAVMGMVAGMAVQEADEISLINNFLITPMVFFGGSFFPLSNLPEWLSSLMATLPIAALNKMLRATSWSMEVAWGAGTMLLPAIAFFFWNIRLIKRYSE